MIHQGILPFKLSMTSEGLTSYGGLSLIGEFMMAVGLRSLVSEHLPSPGSNRGYKPWEYVEAVVYMLQAGGRCLEDMREMKRDSGILSMPGLKRLPSSDALGLWLRRMGADGVGLRGLGNVTKEINARIMSQEEVEEYTLDVDATEITAEKEEASYTYKRIKGYMPMLGYLYENGLCICDEFREGNEAPSARQVEFYKKCKGNMPEGKRIRYYRSDSAAYQAELINSLEDDGVYFTITADMDSAVKKSIQGIDEEDWYEPQEGCGYEVAETVHTMNKSKNPSG